MSDDIMVSPKLRQKKWTEEEMRQARPVPMPVEVAWS